ncbi:MAG: thiamine pyrophosphate-dependent enzyme, partial [Mycobacterium sp.]
VRAKQDLLDKGEGERGNSVVPMMLHGDAAFAGQGVVAETLNLAKLPGYRVGGTIHIIVNNQIGFTTAPEYSRSSEYCTDVAKMIGAPIFHVNGDDPEACVWVAKLAVDFRQEFKKDVIIDMLCYRRRGHNEGDDPSMTNPYMYDVVDVKRGVRKTYTEALIGRGDISMKEAEDALRDYQGQLERVFNDVRELEKHGVQASMSVESNQMLAAGLDTAVDKALLARIGDAFLALPEGFAAHPRVIPVLEKRREMAYEGKIDWAFGELLALGSLVAEGKLIRLSGQDTRRGTFSQRHSVVIDRQTGEEFTPLQLLTVDKALLARIGDAFLDVPEGFCSHPRVQPVLEKRREMAYEGKIDWAFGELLALGSLVAEGKLIRLSGQDTRRGTFSQRHSVIIDRHTGEEFTPLQLLTTDRDGNPTGGKFMVFDSPLSEYAAVGFEYGYTVGNPDALVLWEGQFGDFVNGAQSIIDEFISSGEAKWGQLSSVVLLLPHGHEGQGPDHTSGRIERFLQLWAEGSMTIAVPSTPANYFHLLRRHALDGVQRPLIVFTPKSMLRNKAAVSDIRDFTETKFHSVLEEPTYEEGVGDRSKVTRVLLTSGKIYYEMAARKAKDNRDDVAIVRIEQLAPLPQKRLRETLDRYPNASEYFWVQEEPANQGAWPRFGLELPEMFPDKLIGIKRISRRAMSAPSSGSSKVHAVEQQEILDEAFR